MARIHWPMTTETYAEFLLIDQDLREAVADNDPLKAQEAADRMRSLPFCPFPVADTDLVVPKIVLDPARDRTRRVYSLPGLPTRTLH